MFGRYEIIPESTCKHTSVSKDPILGGYSCTKCLAHFKRVPDALLESPRAMNLWNRLKWALQTRTKVFVERFEWTVPWAKAREHVQRPPWQPHWSNKPYTSPKKFPPSQMAKVYNHPSMRDDRFSNKPRIVK